MLWWHHVTKTYFFSVPFRGPGSFQAPAIIKLQSPRSRHVCVQCPLPFSSSITWRSHHCFHVAQIPWNRYRQYPTTMPQPPQTPLLVSRIHLQRAHWHLFHKSTSSHPSWQRKKANYQETTFPRLLANGRTNWTIFPVSTQLSGQLMPVLAKVMIPILGRKRWTNEADRNIAFGGSLLSELGKKIQWQLCVTVFKELNTFDW